MADQSLSHDRRVRSIESVTLDVTQRAQAPSDTATVHTSAHDRPLLVQGQRRPYALPALLAVLVAVIELAKATV
jgi:hypothetical protein